MNHAGYIALNGWQLTAAAALVLINGLLSFFLKLDLGKSLLIASLRAVAQLLLIGLVLGTVFRFSHWYAVVPVMMVMTATAAFAANGRSKIAYPGRLMDSFVSVAVGGWLITMFSLTLVMQVHPWYDPRYAIPTLGMVLGTTLTAVALGMERVTDAFANGRPTIEAQLAMGATRWEAAAEPIRKALTAAMIPVINQMSVVGVVSLPGMMTGQILAGEAPGNAVRYQIVVMFSIAAASAIGSGLAVFLAYRRLFSRDHRFLFERLRPTKPRRKAVKRVTPRAIS
ncbi:ABC transporter permease [Robbsia andropogonis]|uniref:ABC transporter permease n=1 Tax=Robbsia andropogonis TaxID=28092 RepID=UPI0020A03548|nr:iron export ABC transporter permease subunit FetB [Robbsia andropogonis]MCP1120678.1 iron export ABC transporter permease subunit FetB [Robbsia andropogonis]MCP1130413.1 iron export ABC transporter permease subunit FetB [Robbsia andropogonis]